MFVAVGALLVLIASCDLLGRAAHRVGLPDLIGFLAAGFLLGGEGLGLVGPQREDLLPLGVWQGLGDLGLAALMIGAGMSIPVHLERSVWRRIALFSAATLACLVPAFLTAPLLMDVRADPTFAASSDAALAYQGVLALGVVVTSVPFLTRILSNTSLLATPFGGTVLAVACIVDVAVWSLFPLLVEIRGGESLGLRTLALKPLLTVGFFATLFLLAAAQRRCSPPGAHGSAGRSLHAGFLIVAAALCFAAAEGLGVGVMLAALGFGMFLSRSPVIAALWSRPGAQLLLNRVLIPLYFAMVGAVLSLEDGLSVGLVLAFLAWSSLIKVPVVIAAAATSGAGARASLSYAFALNTRGGPGIVLGGLALDAGLIGAPTFVAFVAASVLTAAAAKPALLRLRRAPAGEAEAELSGTAPAHSRVSLGRQLT